ncbi:MAG: 3-hydroxyacyl-ACP dehydratase FabZ [Erysipelotrichaceae bacterium]|nr:3-hydroxyacyl-ACP dehydratase FabZ [Erysipelotrichaceae bacterium]
MNREEIMKILPHRHDMLLLDMVEDVDGTAVGYYTVRGDEFFLRGHFPNRPIVPGVILLEIMAQSCCVLLKDVFQSGKTPLYTGLNNVRFKEPVKPGDTVIARCHITKARHPFYFARGEIHVNRKICATADFSFAIIGENNVFKDIGGKSR